MLKKAQKSKNVSLVVVYANRSLDYLRGVSRNGEISKRHGVI